MQYADVNLRARTEGSVGHATTNNPQQIGFTARKGFTRNDVGLAIPAGKHFALFFIGRQES